MFTVRWLAWRLLLMAASLTVLVGCTITTHYATINEVSPSEHDRHNRTEGKPKPAVKPTVESGERVADVSPPRRVRQPKVTKARVSKRKAPSCKAPLPEIPPEPKAPTKQIRALKPSDDAARTDLLLEYIQALKTRNDILEATLKAHRARGCGA